jgi:hypothetical protein
MSGLPCRPAYAASAKADAALLNLPSRPVRLASRLPIPIRPRAKLCTRCPDKKPSERILGFQFHQPTSNLDICDAEILVLEHALRKRFTDDPVLVAKIQVRGVVVVE